MRPRTARRGRASLTPTLAALLATLVLSLPAGAFAQPGGELPEQLRVIAGVSFRGLKHLGRREFKAANLKTRRPSWLPWRERPALRLDYLRADTASIAALYRHYGYLDARANWSLESTRDPSAARVVFVIHEGARAQIATVALEGVQAFHEREIKKVLLAQPGRAYDPAFLPIDTLHISVLYQERGFRPHTHAHAERGVPESLAVAVRYRVTEGPRYSIGSVEYESEGRLRESLARRELLVRPGDVFRRSRLEQSVQRLYDTGLYSQVQVSSLADSVPGRLDLVLRVAERRPRWIDLGIGGGSANLFRFTGAWGHRNLDTKALLGSLNGELAVGRQRRDSQSEARVLRIRNGRGSANLVEPWLLGLRLQGQATVFYEQISDDRDSRFLQRRDSRGLELGLLHEFSRMFRASLTGHAGLVHQSYLLFLADPGALPGNVRQRYWDSGLALSLFRDTRDDRITPTRGSFQTLAAEIGGDRLNGGGSYQKLQLVSSWYSPRANGWQYAARFSSGVMGPIGDAVYSPGTLDPLVARVPRERLFFIGGVNSLRGFGENSVPADGGLAMLLANLELRVPLLGPFGAEVFIDAGNVWSEPGHVRFANLIAPWDARHARADDVRYTYGLGARLLLPFGPLRVDLAWSENPDFQRSTVGKVPQRFAYQFAIGPSF